MTNDEIVYTLRCLAELDDDKPSASVVFWAAMLQAEVRKLERRLAQKTKSYDALLAHTRKPSPPLEWEYEEGYPIIRADTPTIPMTVTPESIVAEVNEAALEVPPSEEEQDAIALQAEAHKAMTDQLQSAGGNFERGSLFGHVYKTQ